MRTVLVAAALLLAACGGSPPPNPVIERIEATSSCDRLQGEFDWASARDKVAEMEAADGRMKSLGCY